MGKRPVRLDSRRPLVVPDLGQRTTKRKILSTTHTFTDNDNLNAGQSVKTQCATQRAETPTGRSFFTSSLSGLQVLVGPSGPFLRKAAFLRTVTLLARDDGVRRNVGVSVRDGPYGCRRTNTRPGVTRDGEIPLVLENEPDVPRNDSRPLRPFLGVTVRDPARVLRRPRRAREVVRTLALLLPFRTSFASFYSSVHISGLRPRWISVPPLSLPFVSTLDATDAHGSVTRLDVHTRRGLVPLSRDEDVVGRPPLGREDGLNAFLY